MNKAEARYAAYLSACQEVVSWKFQPMSFWLAEHMRYIPDFLVEYPEGMIHVVDVKALWSTGKPGVEDDALAKIKMMGQLYGDWFTVKLTWYDKAKSRWDERYFEQQERSNQG